MTLQCCCASSDLAIAQSVRHCRIRFYGFGAKFGLIPAFIVSLTLMFQELGMQCCACDLSFVSFSKECQENREAIKCLHISLKVELLDIQITRSQDIDEVAIFIAQLLSRMLSIPCTDELH